MPLSTLTPSGVGTYDTWTFVGAATSWQAMTDDNGDTSYSNGYWHYAIDRVTCQMSDPAEVSAAGAIVSIACYHKTRSTTAPAYTVRPLIYLASTGLWEGAAAALTTSYVLYNEALATRPVSGDPWAVADVAAVEIGLGCGVSDENRRCTYLYGVVDWTTASGFWATLAASLFGSLVGIGMQHAAGLAREISIRKRGFRVKAEEYAGMIREIREGKYAKHFILGGT